MGNDKVPRILREAGMRVVTHKERGFDPDAADIDWIPAVAREGLVIFTKDKNMRRDSVELRVLLRERAIYFALGRAQLTGERQAEIFLSHRRVIERLVREREPPIIAQVNQGEVLVRDNETGKLSAVKRHAR